MTVKETKRRVLWSDEEWIAVARELYRLKPLDQYLKSSSLVALTRHDFFQAQEILPVERRRNPAGIPSMTIVRPKLIEAMVKVRAEVEAAQAAKKAQEEAEAAKAAYVPPPPMNPYEFAFAPFVDLIASRVAMELQEMLAMVMPQVRQYQVKQPDTTARKVKFGVIGPLGVQQNELKKSFPDVEFVFVENGRGGNKSTISAVSGCDDIIGMTDFMEHATDGNLRKSFGERYHRTTGSTSSVKRLLGVLLHSMGQPQKPPAHAH